MKKYPILILHGWNLSSLKYRPLEKELKKKGFKVSCLDLPGFRNTAPISRPYTVADYGKFVLDSLRKLGYKKAILLGHSFGGRIGIYLSVNFPDTVKALILSGTPALGSDLTLKERIYLMAAKTGNVIFSLPNLSRAQDLARRILYKLAGSYDYYKTSGILRETFKNVITYRLEPFLEEIKQPALIIWGADDKIIPVKVAYGMKKLIKNSKVAIISGARHGLPWTHPGEFAETVERFLISL